MTHFIACFTDELEKIATVPGQRSPDLAREQKLEDGARDPEETHYKPKIGIGTLGPSVGGPLLADPSKYPDNRLAP